MVAAVRNGKLRICLDPRDLNKAIKREHYPMKTVEEIVFNISKANLFSALDAKSGFLSILLHKESSKLTTFNTPMGCLRWLRLQFGLKCAPEIFQHITDQILDGIVGATAIMDDILIAGRDRDHHDSILKQVMERATSYNLKLNMQKCKVRQRRFSTSGIYLLQTDSSLTPQEWKPSVICLFHGIKRSVAFPWICCFPG